MELKSLGIEINSNLLGKLGLVKDFNSIILEFKAKYYNNALN